MTTRTFVIRYWDEEVDLNDILLFRAEIPVDSEYLNTELFLEAELKFVDFGSLKEKEISGYVTEFKENPDLLQKVSTAKFKICQSAQMLKEYFPVCFDRQYFCQFHCTLHSTLLNYQFKKKYVVSKKPVKENIHFKDVREYLFKDKFGQQCDDVDLIKTNQIYNGYLNVMEQAHKRLNMYFKKVINEWFSDEQKAKFGKHIQTEALKHPHDANYEEDANFGHLEKVDSNVDLFSSIDSDDQEESKSLIKKKSNIAPTRPKGDEEEIKIDNLIIDNSPQPHNNHDAVLTPSMTYEDISVNDEFQEHHDEADKVEGINDKIIVEPINILLTKDKKFMSKKIPILPEKADFLKTNAFEDLMNSKQLSKVWRKIIKTIQMEPRFLIENLRMDYEVRHMEKIGKCIFFSTIETENFATPIEENLVEIHQELVKNRISQNYHLNMDTIHIQDLEIWKKPESHPILFEECLRKTDYIPPEPTKKLLEDNDFQDFEYEDYYRGCHLFVLVHGFQASSIDMKLLKNSISTVHPEAIFLLSKKNENETEGDIEEMGVRLAAEVEEFIEQYCPGSSLGRLSFIAHSMGGLITRSALPYLEKFKGLMTTFMTLGTPHLGYMYYNSSRLVDAGMWVLKKWKKSISLEQMCMTDASDPKDTFLYKLSQKQGFEWFKNVLLASSFEDMYAPFDSARIQICSKALKDITKGNIYIQMASNSLSRIEVECLYRVDVNFMISKNVLFNSPRAAHIQFLENKFFMNMLVFRFKDFFE